MATNHDGAFDEPGSLTAVSLATHLKRSLLTKKFHRVEWKNRMRVRINNLLRLPPPDVNPIVQMLCHVIILQLHLDRNKATVKLNFTNPNVAVSYYQILKK
jgi:hypothetical protein